MECPDDVVEGGVNGIGDRIAGQSPFACEWGQDGCPRGAGRARVIEGRDT